MISDKKINKFEKGLEICAEAIKLFPKQEFFSINKAFFYRKLKKNKEALKIYKDLIEQFPGDDFIYKNLFELYCEMGKFKNALHVCPEDEDSFKYLCELCFKNKDYKTAIELFDQEDEKSIYCYKQAIRAERGLIKLGILKEGEIEQKL